MMYENTISKLKDEIREVKHENSNLKADLITLKDEMRMLKNDNMFLESYSSRLLTTIRTKIVPDDLCKNARKWRQSSWLE